MASFLLMWPFARLDFDRHHDGYMLAQAMAVHQGASLHVDAFAQYGPVTPWLQSLALFLPIGPGMALRTLNLALIAATVFLLADMGRKSPRGWPVSRAVGWWAAIAWVVLADLWLGIPMHPWSSTLAALLSVATLYFLTRSIRQAEDGETRAASISGLAGGVFLGLMPFTRINVGVSAVAVCLVVAVLIFVRERSSKGRLVALFVLGAFLSSLTIVVALFLTSALAEFFYQSIAWPLTWAENAAALLHPEDFVTLAFYFQAFPVALAGGALLLQHRAGRVHQRWSVSRSEANIFTALVGLIILSWENFEILTSVRESPGLLISGVTSYLRTPNLKIIDLFIVMSIVGALVTCITQVFIYVFRERSSRRVTPWLLLGGLALSGLTQVFPTWDPRHEWWGAPIGLLLLFALVQTISTLNRPTGNPLMLLVLGTLVMAVFSGSAYLGFERVEGERGSLIEGMSVSSQELTRISQDTKFLGQQLPGAKPVVYLVWDGDLSILDGRYRSADSYFVVWVGPPPQVQTRIANGNPLVVQRSVFADDKISELARSVKYRVVARNERLAVLMPLGSAAARSAPHQTGTRRSDAKPGVQLPTG